MSLWKKIRGTVESYFQLGIGGPTLKNNSGNIEARNSGDSAFVPVRVGNASDSSDALNTPSHKAVDSLVHDIAETCYEEVTRDGSNRVTDVIVWTNPGKTVKIREVNVTRTSGRVSQIVRKQYDAGGTLIATVTSVIARSGGRVSDITHTET